MKIIHFFFLIFIIYYCNCDFTCTVEKYHIIDTTSPDYEYDIELDWTDYDERTITVPFVNLESKEEIIPLFVNGTSLQLYEGLEITNVDEISEEINKKAKDHKLYETHSTFNEELIDVNNNKLKMVINSNDFKANKNDVKKKYIKYFCWYECGKKLKSSFRISSIIVTVNNAKFLKLSKYLIGFLLLFL